MPPPREKLVELVCAELSQPAPEDEMLGRRDGRDRVELEEAEPAHGLEDSARGAVEALRVYRDPSRLLARAGCPGSVAPPRPDPQAYRPPSTPRTRASRAAARSSFALKLPRTR